MSRSENVPIPWYGGCGRSVTVRKSNMRKADYYLCHSRQDGARCEQKLPPRQPGKVRVIDMYAAGSFWGYRHEWPDAEALAAVIRGREIFVSRLANMVIVIEKASQCN